MSDRVTSADLVKYIGFSPAEARALRGEDRKLAVELVCRVLLLKSQGGLPGFELPKTRSVGPMRHEAEQPAPKKFGARHQIPRRDSGWGRQTGLPSWAT